MLRGRLFLAGFVTIAAIAVTIPAAGASGLVTVCGGGSQVSREARNTAPVLKPMVNLAYAAPQQISPAHQIALLKGAEGYDIIFNWGDESETSLRSTGAEVLDAEVAPGLLHLMVEGGAASGQNYLFSLDDSGSGELLWGRQGATTDAGLNRATCSAKSGPR